MAVFSKPEEVSLLTRLAADDHVAFSELYHAYWKKLFGIAFHHLQSRPAAEDVVQEVFASIWVRRRTLTIQSIDAYLATATRYSIIRIIANRKTEQSFSQRPGATESYHLYDERFLDQALQQEINRLPSKCRLVFQYSRNQGLSNKEIGAEMNVTEKAVEKHISKAIRHLRVKLKDFLPLLLLSLIY